MTNSNNTNKFNNYTTNENLGFLNSTNTNQNANNIRGINIQSKLDNQIKNTSFSEENQDQAHQRNLRFSFNNMLGNPNNLSNKANFEGVIAAGNFNKENIFEKIDISNDNIELNEEENSGRKTKLFDSDNKSNAQFMFGKSKNAF